jgi:formylmethanofuran dehydrogenase subunit B
VFGLGDAPCEAQRLAVSIGDRIGACVDGGDIGATNIALSRVGMVTATLGEVAERGDVVVFWGADPAENQPRHFERYSLSPEGTFVPGGRADRTCVVVDVQATKTSDAADHFLRIKPGKDFEAIWTLRALAAGIDVDRGWVERATGVTLADWNSLVEELNAARFGAVFYGPGVSGVPNGHATCEALFSFVRDMNQHSRCVAIPIGEAGNRAGAENVLTWQTGYPCGVNFTRGYPRSNPGEYTAGDVLTRGEADVALVLSSDPVNELSPAASKHLQSIPVVTLTSAETPLSNVASVAFMVSRYGIHTGGTVFRVDGVPLPLRPTLASNYPSQLQVLEQIEQRIGAKSF